jgi:ribosomal protein S18 acetylase RimI-like enzyme
LRRVDEIAIEPARPEDDPELRRLLRDNPMDGEIRVSLEREPNTFLAAAVEGEPHCTIVARDQSKVIGMGSRSVWNAFVNGEPCRLGYLSQLRVDRAFRGRPRLLAAGYDLLRSLRGPDELPFDVTSVIADNQVARRLLGAGLPGLPVYREIEGFVTMVIPTTSRSRRVSRIERGSRDRIAVIAACLERNRRRYQLAPRFSVEDLLSPERSRGLAPEDFFVAISEGQIVGCLALWDQSSFKQVVVRGYAPRLARWRPWLNRAAPLFGAPRLPDPGELLPHAYVSHVAVDGDDLNVFQSLLEAAYAQARVRRYVYLAIGLAARHPWLPWLVQRFKPREYASVLYAVHWQDGADAVAALDRRIPHVEVALL